MTEQKYILASNIIRRFESLHDGDLSQIGLQPKLAPEGYYTEGWGHLIIDPETKKPLTVGQKARAYKLAKVSAKEEADKLLVEDLHVAEMRIIPILKVVLSDNEYATMLDLCFNLSYNSSITLINHVNTDKELFKKKVLLYCKDSVKKQILPGLKIRRICDRLLFEGREWQPVANELQRKGITINELLQKEGELFKV
jgi:GH24 family phage-related lysozyme (muramidase)